MKNIFKKKNYITEEQFKEHEDCIKALHNDIDKLKEEVDRLRRIVKYTCANSAGFDIYTKHIYPNGHLARLYGLGKHEYYLRVYVNGEEHAIKLNEDVGTIDENTKYIEWANGSDFVTIQFVANKFAIEDSCEKYRFVVDLKNDSYIQTTYIDMNRGTVKEVLD